MTRRPVSPFALVATLLVLGGAHESGAAAPPAPIDFGFAWPAPGRLAVEWSLESTQFEGESPWSLKLVDSFALRIEPRGEELEIRLERLARPEPILWGLFPADFPEPVMKAIDGGYHDFVPGFRVSRGGAYLGLIEPDSVRERFTAYHARVRGAVPNGHEQSSEWLESVDDLITTRAVNQGLSNLWGALVAEHDSLRLAVGERITRRSLETTTIPGVYFQMLGEWTLARQLDCGAPGPSAHSCVELRTRLAPTDESATAFLHAIRKSLGGNMDLPDPTFSYRLERTLITHPGTLVPVSFEDRKQSELRFGAYTVYRLRWVQRFRFVAEPAPAPGTTPAAAASGGGPL